MTGGTRVRESIRGFGIDRALGQIISVCGALLYAGLAAREYAAPRAYESWWEALSWGLFAALLLFAVLGGVLPQAVLRIGWAGIPLLGFALQLLTFAAYPGAEPDVVFEWRWLLNPVLLSYTVLGGVRASAVMAIALASGFLPVLSGALALDRIPTAAGLQTPIQACGFVLPAILLTVRARLRRLRATEREARAAEESRARAVAEAERQARVSRFVHDEVLATLSAALRFSGPVPAELRDQAGRAREALDEPSPPPFGAVPSDRFVRRLIDAVSGIDPRCQTEVDAQAESVPEPVSDALLGAVREAMRNSVRHAGPAAHRTVHARVREEGVRVEIADDGVGFAPAEVGDDRLGLRRSIRDRMIELDGGEVELDSAVGAGTRVRLIWRRPEAPRSASPTAASAETAGSGLAGGRGRTAMVAVWAFHLVYAALSGSLAAGVWVWGAYAAGLAGAVLLTRSGNRPLSRPAAAGVALCAAVNGAAVFSYPVPSASVWVLAYAGALAALLVVRGNPVIGMLAWAAVVSVGLVWAASREAVRADYIDLFSILLLMLVVSLVWLAAAARMVTRERVHRAETARARVARDIAEGSVERTRRDLAAVRAEVRPIFARLASGAPNDAELRRRTEVTEATIRDRIRSPRLQHPMLGAAVTELRERGVEVLLLGEAEDGESRSTISDELADSLRRAIRSLGPGSAVTIRALPNRDDAEVSVVLAGPHGGRSMRFSRTGRLLSER